jgi:hypothetical protein
MIGMLSGRSSIESLSTPVSSVFAFTLPDAFFFILSSSLIRSLLRP